MKKSHISSSLDSFLEKEEILGEATIVAIKRMLAWQIVKPMKQKHLNKAEMARLMKTSRAVVDRLLDPKNISLTLQTLDRVASVLGKKLNVELVDENYPLRKAS